MLERVSLGMNGIAARTLGSLILICGTTAWVDIAAAQQQTQQSVQQSSQTLQRAVVAYRNAETLAIRFDQTVTNPLTERAARSSGELLRKRPNLLSVTFSMPASDRIVADGTDLWLYLPSSAPGQVIRMPASGQQGIFLDPLGQILSAPPGHYLVTAAGTARLDGHETHAVTLTSRSGHDLFTTATVWVDDRDGAVRKIETTEPSGLTRRVTITQFRKNVSIPSSAFRFTAPANVRVIDQRGMFGG